MLRKTVSGIMLTLLLTSMVTLAFKIQPVKTEPATITVPDNYSTIQAAINAANLGDAIFVKNGIYYENVVINKTVSLIGEDSETTIIDGGGVGSVVNVTASNVTISGFTIQNSGSYFSDSGLYIFHSIGSSISGNIVTQNGAYGVYLYASNYSIIEDNVVTSNCVMLENSCENRIVENVIANNQYGCAITVSGGMNNKIIHNEITSNINGIELSWWFGAWPWSLPYCTEISGNTITNNTYRGILLRGTSGIVCNNTIASNREGMYFDVVVFNNISYNKITSNYESGIQIAQDSWGNVFRHNNLSSNGWNFGVFAGNLPDFEQDIDYSNTVNGRPIYYWVDERDKQVPADAGYVAAINCVNITVRDLSLTNNLQGVLFAGTTNSTVENNNVSNSWIGIQLTLASSQNAIYNNTIKNNEWRGIELMTGCSQNNISGNSITSNIPVRTSSTPWYIPIFTPRMGIGLCLSGWSHENIIRNNWIALNGYGIYIGSERDWDPLHRPDNNTVSENTVVHNYLYGIQTSYSSGNLIFHNIFLDNWRQVQTIDSTNIWDDGYASGGNYWSDYAGEDVDSDGIGDTPYVIDENNQDRYLLMAPWTLPAEHELAAVLRSPILLQLGDSAVLNATVANKGLYGETNIVLSIFINGTVAKSTIIASLQPNSHYTLSYLLIPHNEGVYNVTAYASALSGEKNIANNLFSLFVKVKTPIVVPDDYTTIKEAVNAANAEGTIFVRAGIYDEDVLIDKFGLRIVGQNPETTIVKRGIKVTAPKVSIIDLKIQRGVYLEISWGCTVTGNMVGGIGLWYSSNNVLAGNNITYNYGAGIEFDESSYNIVYGNNLTDNSGPGIDLYKSSANTFSNNNIIGNRGCGVLGSGSNNKIYRNKIANNSGYGIRLMSTCKNNAVSENKIVNNEGGIDLSGVLSDWYKECPENNLINENIIANNKETGVRISGSLNNIFYHNSFVNSTNHVTLSNTRGNVWNDGYPSGGNYWSDYNGTDLFSGPYQNETGSDGIGDIQYVIDADNLDRYPLMEPYPPTRTVGVNIGDWAMYDVAFSWTGTYQPDYEDMNNTEWLMIEVTAISGTVITFDGTLHFRNGSGQVTTDLTWDVAPPGSYGMGFWFIGANLSAGDSIYQPSSTRVINETVIRTYKGLPREVNHFNASILYYDHYNVDCYWDRATGILTEQSLEWQSISTPTDSFSLCLKMIETNIWSPTNVPLVGDLNHDGKVNIQDVMVAALAFYSYPSHPRWNPIADINNDNTVNIIDIVLIAKNFGRKL